MTIRRRVVAEGRVQGVFFRDSVRRAASTRGVAGWARNREDGTVEAVFEGESDAVESMIEVVRGSPGHSHVTETTVTDEQPEGLSGFETR